MDFAVYMDYASDEEISPEGVSDLIDSIDGAVVQGQQH